MWARLLLFTFIDDNNIKGGACNDVFIRKMHATNFMIFIVTTISTAYVLHHISQIYFKHIEIQKILSSSICEHAAALGNPIFITTCNNLVFLNNLPFVQRLHERIVGNLFDGYFYLEDSWFLKSWFIQLTLYSGILFFIYVLQNVYIAKVRATSDERRDHMREERERDIAQQQLEYHRENSQMFQELIRLVHSGKSIESGSSVEPMRLIEEE